MAHFRRNRPQRKYRNSDWSYPWQMNFSSVKNIMIFKDKMNEFVGDSIKEKSHKGQRHKGCAMCKWYKNMGNNPDRFPHRDKKILAQQINPS